MRWQKLVRDNRWTVFMGLCVVVLYLFLFIAGLFSKESRATLLKDQKERISISAALKLKEEAVKQKLLASPVLMNALSLSFFLTLVAGVCLDIRFVRQKIRGLAWGKSPPHETGICWGLPDVFQALVLLFFAEGCLFLFQSLGYWVTGLELSPDVVILGNSLIRDIAVLFFILQLIRRRSGDPFSDLRLGTRDWPSFIRLGLLSYVAITPLLVLTFAILAMGMNIFSYEPVPQNVVQMYLKPEAQPYLLIFSVFVAALGPVMEEIFFRGFAYPALRKRLGIPGAAVITAAVFAAFHMNLVAFLPIFVLGLFLSYLYESSGSLIPSISAHVLHNTLMVLVTLGFRTLSQ